MSPNRESLAHAATGGLLSRVLSSSLLRHDFTGGTIMETDRQAAYGYCLDAPAFLPTGSTIRHTSEPVSYSYPKLTLREGD